MDYRKSCFVVRTSVRVTRGQFQFSDKNTNNTVNRRDRVALLAYALRINITENLNGSSSHI